MANDAITWADLLEIYRNSVWVDDHTASLTIVSDGIARTLKLVEKSDRAYHEADIALQDDKAQLAVGSVVEVRIGSPHRSLGLLSKDWDALLASSFSRMREPSAFFIRSDKTHNETLPPTETLLKYRSTLKLVKMLSESALFADQQQAKLVYFADARVEVQVKFAAKDLRSIDPAQVDLLEKVLEGEVHAEQRLGILADAVVELVSGQSAAGRFHYLMQNVDELVRRVHDGYRLFASSFSYSKIRSELEKTQSEYVARIHKTFSDIQGQLLGLPVASVVVATQLKAPTMCGPELLSNIAVVCGACLFAALLIASCINQWMTLDAISNELKGQRTRLNAEFSEIKDLFTGSFDALDGRILWQRWIMGLIVGLSVIGAGFTVRAYLVLTNVDAWSCLVRHGPTS
ncbi:hypothetical protein [Pleomorphomonas sp. NRK KF1]|uniref:hypothetical protein n=1 Tax=Pleomorphomonas sp. NRK KF1 TaxID=2943000 RepID=UPI00204464B5|nr:hypothetical protein [Pleomorphomonas sp. NRK KF1]MCM5553340.1 hypothetical protein [Pleomorphomonas sp. NRK KF1]